MIFDITDTETKPFNIPLPQSVKDALKAEDITAPEKVVMQLREATLEERQGANSFTSDVEGAVHMIMARAEPGTDERVVRALARKLTPSSVGVITAAYLTGEYPDPKAVAARVQEATRIGMGAI
ncbi:hypothetical protein [Deinococcus daejeonensis]|uniref:Uncharacterized protein n=1 Tax=Deinococcus daejeonensis TaxID=1007098 RepID=A0ABQ2IVL1_9DEIO|nr:hypothetical protein [Deinococcus daejeonensis]GGN32249.1 hypothetical protein GCM10010842_08770 [Deinococcus daejeonensis]